MTNRPLRVAIAGFQLESVTFLGNLTTLADFQITECDGETLLTRHRTANTPIGGFIRVLEAGGAEIAPLVYAEVGAAGPASDEAYDHYLQRILNGIAGGGFDGVLLDLHGAMTTPTRLDADRDTIDAVRAAIGPDVRLMVTFDYHANIDETTIRGADAVFGYHYSPHTDMGATGERAARCMLRTLRGEIDPVWALRRPQVMVPSPFSTTSLEPLASLVREVVMAPEMDHRCIDLSLFAGFSYADVPNCGFAALAVTDRNPALAASLAQRFSDAVRERRQAINHPARAFSVQEGIDEAIRIKKNAEKPVVLLEFPDRLNDSTYVLREVVKRRLGRTAVPYLWDADAAKAAAEAGVGATVALDIGGRSTERAGGPVRIEGVVRHAKELQYRISGPYWTGRQIDLGMTVVIDTGELSLSVTTRPFTANDEDCFTNFGMRAADFDYIVLRSKTHFRAAYDPISAATVLIDTPDWGTLDMTLLPYMHVDRDKVYPFAT